MALVSIVLYVMLKNGATDCFLREAHSVRPILHEFHQSFPLTESVDSPGSCGVSGFIYVLMVCTRGLNAFFMASTTKCQIL